MPEAWQPGQCQVAAWRAARLILIGWLSELGQI